MPVTVFFAQASKQEYSAFLAQYGPEEALIGPRVRVHTTGGIYGTANRTRFSDAGLDAKIEKAQTEMDPVKRKKYVQEAIEASMEEQAIIPILHPSWLMGSKTGVTITPRPDRRRSEEHTSELQSLMRISYAGFCLTKTNNDNNTTPPTK